MTYDKLRSALRTAQRHIMSRMDTNQETADLGRPMPDEISELSMYDNHPADVATELYLRGIAVGDKVRDEAHLEDIREALDRMDAGTYGICASCHEEIPIERLNALPTARFCITCQTYEEQQKKHLHRPVEEEVLSPGFGAVTFDNKDATFFDGEDAYQAVARFEEPAFGEEYYEQPELDDDVGYVDPIDEVSQDMYNRTLPSSPELLTDYDEPRRHL